MPDALCKPPVRKNGTSAPRRIAIELKSQRVRSNEYISHIPFRMVAALEDPPPKPLLIGIFFSKLIETPPMSKCLESSFQAVTHKFESLFFNQSTLETKLQPCSIFLILMLISWPQNAYCLNLTIDSSIP